MWYGVSFSPLHMMHNHIKVPISFRVRLCEHSDAFTYTMYGSFECVLCFWIPRANRMHPKKIQRIWHMKQIKNCFIRNHCICTVFVHIITGYILCSQFLLFGTYPHSHCVVSCMCALFHATCMYVCVQCIYKSVCVCVCECIHASILYAITYFHSFVSIFSPKQFNWVSNWFPPPSFFVRLRLNFLPCFLFLSTTVALNNIVCVSHISFISKGIASIYFNRIHHFIDFSSAPRAF